MKFIVHQLTDKVSFMLTTDEGKTLANSLDFSSQEACIEAIRGLTTRLPDGSTYRLSEKSFSLLLNGLTVANSPEYETSAAATAAMNDLLKDAEDEATYEVQVITQSESKQSKFVDVPSLSNINYASLYDFNVTSVLRITGFEPVFLEDDSHSFLYNDANGKELVYSRKFDSTGKRDRRIRQLIKSSSKNERFEIIEENNTYYFIIKAANQAEIARSITFETKTEAEKAVQYCKSSMGAFEEQYPEPAKKIKKSNLYNFSIKPDSEQLGFYALQDESKDYYFVLNGNNGRPLLFSQGYTSGSSRDNGIKTVIRNASMKDQHDIREENGKYFFILRSGNRQEIARSALFASEQEAKERLEWTLTNVRSYAESYGVVVETTVMQTQTDSFVIDVDLPKNALTGKLNEDEYLNCEAYANHSETPAEGFRTFTVDGEHYFAMVNPEGEVLLRSEGYPTISARDNGLASVQRNREIKERYSVIEDGGEHFVVLKAANHKEIARSCGYANETAAYGVFSFINGNGTFPWMLALVPTLTGSGFGQDEYLDCEAYANHNETPAAGFRTFTVDGEHYFAMVNPEGEVLLRSEGYPTISARDNGLASVQKNREIKERYSVVEDKGDYFVVLKAANHKEIARSCGYRDKSVLFILFPFLDAGHGGGFPWEIVGISAAAAVITPFAATAGSASLETDEEVPPAIPPSESFTPIIEPSVDGKVGEVEEGETDSSLIGLAAAASAAAITPLAAAAASTDLETDKVVTSATPPSESFTPIIEPLVDGKVGEVETGEIDSPMTGLAAAVGAAAITAGSVADNDDVEPTILPPAATSPVSGYASAGGGATTGGLIPRWLWALLGAVLLAALLWWLLRGCTGGGSEVPYEAAGTPPVIVADSVDNSNTGNQAMANQAIAADTLPPPPPPPVETKSEINDNAENALASNAASNAITGSGVDCDCDSGKEPLFMRYSYEPKVLTKLGSNTEFGNSHKLSPSAFYKKLNNAYGNNAVDRRFLDRIFRSMGYAAGWKAATPSMFSNTTVPFGTIGNIGYGKDHRTQYSKLNLGEYDQQAFLIKSRNGCDVRFMKTCGNHMFYCTK